MAQVPSGLGWDCEAAYLVEGGPVIIGSAAQIVGATSYYVADNGTSQSAVVGGGTIFCEGTWGGSSNPVYYKASAPSGAKVQIYRTSNLIRWCSFEPTQVAWARVKQSTGLYDSGYTVTNIASAGTGTQSGIYYGGGASITGTFVDVPKYQTQNPALPSGVHLDPVQPIYKLNDGAAIACAVEYNDEYGTRTRAFVLISTIFNATAFSLDGINPTTYVTYTYTYAGLRFYMSMYKIEDAIQSNGVYASLTNFSVLYPEGVFNALMRPDWANVYVTAPPSDPYSPFAPTGEGGGVPNPNTQDDDIEEAPLPTVSFASGGFCRIYSPTLSQLNALSNYMWTDTTFLNTVINHLKQLLEDPMDSVISLSLVPCTPRIGVAEEVKVMYVPTGVYMAPVENQFVRVDCGTLTLEEMYGSALDYNPYTKVQLYLPYIGTVQLDTDEVMGKTLGIVYRIDIVTGLCCASVSAGSDILYQFSGHCSIPQPINSADFSGYVGAAMAAGKLVGGIVAAGAGAPGVAATLLNSPGPSISGTETDVKKTERNPTTGRQITSGTEHTETTRFNPGASFGEMATRGISNTVGAIMSSKMTIQHSGGFSGNSGYMASVRRPYLIVTRPRIANPENYGRYNGRPSMMYLSLGNCSGYTQVQSIQLTGIDATNPELSEIATLLMSGVIL